MGLFKDKGFRSIVVARSSKSHDTDTSFEHRHLPTVDLVGPERGHVLLMISPSIIQLYTTCETGAHISGHHKGTILQGPPRNPAMSGKETDDDLFDMNDALEAMGPVAGRGLGVYGPMYWELFAARQALYEASK